MKKTLINIIALLLISNFLFAQQYIAASATSKIKPHQFERIQNKAISFSMIISSDEILENEEDAPFLLFVNETSNALFVKKNDGKATFEVELINVDKEVVATKKNLKEIMLLDLSIYQKGTYTLRLTSNKETETHKIILR